MIPANPAKITFPPLGLFDASPCKLKQKRLEKKHGKERLEGSRLFWCSTSDLVINMRKLTELLVGFGTSQLCAIHPFDSLQDTVSLFKWRITIFFYFLTKQKYENSITILMYSCREIRPNLWASLICFLPILLVDSTWSAFSLLSSVAFCHQFMHPVQVLCRPRAEK